MTDTTFAGRTIAVATVGCKLNYAESSSIAAEFVERGGRLVPFEETADVVLINTCTVTSHADSDCRRLIRQAVRRSPEGVIIVTGCYAQLHAATLATMEGVDLVLGTAEKGRALDHLAAFHKRDITEIHCHSLDESAFFTPAASSEVSGRTRAFLKIQDGCDYSCSYCTIPAARGGSRSMDTSDAVAAARRLLDDGFHELVLSGVNVGDFGRRSGGSLHELLLRLLDLDGDFRIRISSIEPNLLTDDIIHLTAEHDRLCRHFHIPLQSGSREVLAAMRRRHGTDLYRDRVLAVHAALPDACIGADVIVGFPGETDALFDETAAFIGELPLSYLHVFRYSDRPNAESHTWGGKVDGRSAVRRSRALHVLSEAKRRAFWDSRIGHSERALMEARVSGTDRIGLTSNFIPVALPAAAARENTFVRVRLTAVMGEGMRAEPVDHMVMETGE